MHEEVVAAVIYLIIYKESLICYHVFFDKLDRLRIIVFQVCIYHEKTAESFTYIVYKQA